jgi:hypothetical protein
METDVRIRLRAFTIDRAQKGILIHGADNEVLAAEVEISVSVTSEYTV